jgi:hypothetical protein
MISMFAVTKFNSLLRICWNTIRQLPDHRTSAGGCVPGTILLCFYGGPQQVKGRGTPQIPERHN